MKKLNVFILALSLIAVTGAFTLYREEMALDKRMAHLFALETNETNGAEKGSDHHQEISDEPDDSEAHQAEAHHEHTQEDGIISLTDEQIQKMGLRIQTAAKGEILLSLSTRGKIILDPDRLAHIIPKVSGIAKEARKNIGNRVKQGEIIAVLESLDIAALKAAYLAAVSKEKLNASILERETRLYQKGSAQNSDYKAR